MTLRARSVAGLVTVQDLGRPGFMHQGVPPGGALVPAWLRAANAAAGNAEDAAALEVMGRLVVEATADVVLATEDGDALPLRAGQAFTLEPRADRRVRYLALRGGVDVPLVLGSRSTLVVAALGGLEGRALRRGDELACGQAFARAASVASPPTFVIGGDVVVDAGPDGDGLDGDYVLEAASNRVGTRLVGRPLSAPPLGASAPLVKGAIEVPPDGMPLVLGPEHPTTGGYPVVGVVRDLDAFFTLPVGSRVRFRRGA